MTVAHGRRLNVLILAPNLPANGDQVCCQSDEAVTISSGKLFQTVALKS